MMQITNNMIWGLAGLLVAGIAGHQMVLHRVRQASASQDQTLRNPVPAESATSVPPTRSETSAEDANSIESLREPSPEPDRSLVANPLDNPVMRDILLQSQVRRMEKYADEAGPGDPFSLTPAEIEEFRQRGDPVVW